MTQDPDTRPADALYVRLEVAPDASPQQIVSAYRRLAHGAHPDVHPADPEAAHRFREITEAYDVLSDPFRRAAYDRFRSGERRDVAPPVRVVRRPEPSSDHSRHGQPITLGIDLPPTKAAAVPLWAGPVRVEAGSRPVHANFSDSNQVPLAEMASLLSRILESWWRY